MSIIETADLPEEEQVHLSKDIFGQYHVVYPLKNIDGTWNWKNIITGGSLWDFWLVIVIVTIICLLFYEYNSNLKFCADILNSVR